MKNKVMATLVLLASTASYATVGVAVGANQFADDGFPQLGPKEQVKAFYCHAKTGRMSGPQAQDCALEKCRMFFKVPKDAKLDKHGIVGGRCKPDSWSERPGHALGYVGDPGDNQYLFSKAIGDATREEAMKWVKENNFPVKEKNKVFDFFDDGNNGRD